MTSRVVFGLDELLEQCGYETGSMQSAVPDVVAAMQACRAHGLRIAVAVPHPLAASEAADRSALAAAGSKLDWLTGALEAQGVVIDELLVGQIGISPADWLLDDKALTLEEFAAGDPEHFAALLRHEEIGA